MQKTKTNPFVDLAETILTLIGKLMLVGFMLWYPWINLADKYLVGKISEVYLHPTYFEAIMFVVLLRSTLMLIRSWKTI